MKYANYWHFDNEEKHFTVKEFYHISLICKKNTVQKNFFIYCVLAKYSYF